MSKPLSKDAEITIKQRKFVKNRLSGDNKAVAARKAGYVSQGYGSFLDQQPHIQTMLQQALERKGLTDDKVADVLDDGLKAFFVKKDGGTEYPDFHAREKYLVNLIKIKGGFAPEKHEVTEKRIILMITPDFKKGLLDSGLINKKDEEIIDAEIIKEEDDD